MAGVAPLRIVHVAPVVPVTGGNGLAMRTSMFAEAAARLGECTTLVTGQPDGRLAAFPLPDGVRVEILEGLQDTRLRLISMAEPASSRPRMLLDYGRPSLCTIMPAPMVSQIGRRLAGLSPDLVIISRAYMLPLLEGMPSALANVPVAVDLDDDDAAYQLARARLARHAGNIDAAAMYDAEAVLFDLLIEAHALRVRRFWIASETGRANMAGRCGLTNIRVVHNAVEMRPAGAVAPTGPPKLLFVGNLGYEPNSDGISWFIREILPRVRKCQPSVKLTVAGSSCPAALRRLCQEVGIDLVEDPVGLDPVYAAATAVIVPLRFGSGSRLKIIEAGARSIPVISTVTGADGLDLDPDNHFIQSTDNAEAFALACNACLSDLPEARRRAGLLRQRVAAVHDRSQAVEQILAELRGLLQC